MVCPSNLRIPLAENIGIPSLPQKMTNLELWQYTNQLIGQIELAVELENKSVRNCQDWLKSQGVKVDGTSEKATISP